MPRQSSNLSPQRLREFARAGAEATVRDLRAQIAAIQQTFPELRRSGGAIRQANGAAQDAQPQRRRRGMSAAARRAVSLRMKKYWAARRKAGAK